MKKTILILLALAAMLPLSASVSIEGATGLSYNMTYDSSPMMFGDMTVTYDDWSIYMEYRYRSTFTADIQYKNTKGILNHQANVFSRWILSEGGFTAAGYMLILNLGVKGFYFNLGLGTEGALSYSPYSKEPLFILSPQARVRLGYRSDIFGVCIFLENNYRSEKEWNAKTSLGLDFSFFLSSEDTLLLTVSATSCEVLMDPYRILYSSRVRAGWRRVL